MFVISLKAPGWIRKKEKSDKSAHFVGYENDEQACFAKIAAPTEWATMTFTSKKEKSIQHGEWI